MVPVYNTYNLPLTYTSYYACCFGSLGGEGGSNPTIQRDKIYTDKTVGSLKVISTQANAGGTITGCFVIAIGY